MNIVIIGTGNVATQLTHALIKSNKIITQVYGRHIKEANILAKKAGAMAISDLSKLDLKADLCFICVSDDVIADIARQISPKFKGIIVHTAGSVSLDVFKKFSHSGVFYPLQTLQKSLPVSFQNIPVLVEGSSKKIEGTLKKIAQSISKQVYVVSSKDRLILHLSAVYVNNFSNFMYVMAEEILKKHKLPFSYLHPLLLETAQKATRQSPTLSQTGPAKRGDHKTMKKHLALLKGQKTHQEVYRYLSVLITGK